MLRLLHRLLLVATFVLCSLLLLSAQPCTLSIDGETALLSNSLVTLRLNLSNAQCLSLHSSHLPGINLLYNTNGPCAWDREPPEVRPSGLQWRVVRNSSSLVHVHMEDGATPVLSNFRWSFDYALAASVSGVYVFGTVSHPPEAEPEALMQYRWIARINPGDDGEEAVVDSVGISSIPPVHRLLPSVAEARAGRQLSPSEAELVTLANGTVTAEHKYDYCLDSSQHAIHGLFHSRTGLGVWTLSPHLDYHNGAFDAQDLTSYGPTVYTGLYFAHIQMLNGGHYGSGDETVRGDWAKLYGPWLFYINRGNASISAWDDAWLQYRKEMDKWPYAFVHDTNYSAANRGDVTGSLLVHDLPDPRSPAPSAADATVFLTAPTAVHGPYTAQSQGYTYWNRTDSDGRFRLSGVRSGLYELHITVPGIIGELGGKIVKVAGQQVLDIGSVEFTVPRNGTTVWEVGYADRTAAEYKHGDAYRYWGLYDLFGSEFPYSVHYQIKSWRQPSSQWRRDWNYAHVPVNGSQTNWTLYFDVPNPVTGPAHPAFLRIAFAGVVRCQLLVRLNGNTTATVSDLDANDSSIYRDGIHGIYQYRVLQLDSSALKETGNVLVLTCLCRERFDGLMYDALKFELQGWTPPAVLSSAL